MPTHISRENAGADLAASTKLKTQRPSQSGLWCVTMRAQILGLIEAPELLRNQFFFAQTLNQLGDVTVKFRKRWRIFFDQLRADFL